MKFTPKIHNKKLEDITKQELPIWALMPKRPYFYKEEYEIQEFVFGDIMYTEEIWINPLSQDMPYEEPPRKKRKYRSDDIQKFIANVDHLKFEIVKRIFRRLMKNYVCHCDYEYHCGPHGMDDLI